MSKIELPSNVNELAKLHFAEQNRLMVEGKVMPLTERMANPGSPSARLGEAVAKALEAANPSFKGIEVSGCDTPNGNRRIYPVQTWASALERMQPRIETGRVYGSVDHPSWGEGAMKDAPIRWTKLGMDKMDRVLGDYTITADHSRGKDLIANLNAGWGLAFSTRGYGTAHYPDADEKVKYGLGDGDDDVVIIDPTYECIAIDVVDNPSWKTAVQSGNTPPASKKDNNQGDNPPTTEHVMKNLADLKAAHPALVAEAETAAVKDVTEKLTTANASKSKIGEAVKSLFTGVASELGVPLERVTTPSEVATQIEGLNKTITDQKSAIDRLEKELAASKEALKTAQEGKQTAEGKITDAERRTAVVAAQSDLLKDNPFEALIKKRLGEKVADPTFTVDAQKKFVADLTAECKALADEMGANPNNPIRVPGARKDENLTAEQQAAAEVEAALAL